MLFMPSKKVEEQEKRKQYDREYKKRRYSEDPEYRLRMKEYARMRRKTTQLVKRIGDL